MPKDMFRVFCNGLIDFVKKELAEELERKCSCLGEDTEK